MCFAAKATLSYRPDKRTTQVFQTTINNTHPASEKTAQNVVSICVIITLILIWYNIYSFVNLSEHNNMLAVKTVVQ